MLMTDNQLEAAARALCEMRRLDPDAETRIDMSKGTLSVFRYAPMWERAAKEIREREFIELAIKAGRETQWSEPPRWSLFITAAQQKEQTK